MSNKQENIGISFIDLSADELGFVQKVLGSLDNKLQISIEKNVNFSANMVNIVIASCLIFFIVLYQIKKSDNVPQFYKFKLAETSASETFILAGLILLLLLSGALSIWVMFEQKQIRDIQEQKEKQYISSGVGLFCSLILFGYLFYILRLNRSSSMFQKVVENKVSILGFKDILQTYSVQILLLMFFVMLYVGINALGIANVGWASIKKDGEFKYKG